MDNETSVYVPKTEKGNILINGFYIIYLSKNYLGERLRGS